MSVQLGTCQRFSREVRGVEAVVADLNVFDHGHALTPGPRTRTMRGMAAATACPRA
jgi:hypothetical protein